MRAEAYAHKSNVMEFNLLERIAPLHTEKHGVNMRKVFLDSFDI